MNKVTQFQQEIEQLHQIQERVLSLIEPELGFSNREHNELFARTYFAVTTLKKVFEDLDNRHENQDHHL